MCDASAGCTSGCTAPPALNPPTTTASSSTGTATPVTTADDYDNYGPEDYIPCDYTKTFANLEVLNAAADGLRVECLAAYAMRTLITMLDTAHNKYTSVNNDYDKEFGHYVTYIRRLVPSVLDNSFMFDDKKSTGGFPYAGRGMSCKYCTISTVADMPDTDYIH